MAEDTVGADVDKPVAHSAADLESTARLIERARAGEQEALERLMTRHLTPLRRWARGRLPRWARDLSDTDDLLQDTLLRTFRRLDWFEARGPGALQAYLRQAVLNRVRSELRRQGRRPAPVALEDAIVSDETSPLESAIGREALERYERALAALEPADREAVIGRIEMGYSYRELADATDRPTAEAARKAAQRALVKLVREMNRTT